MGEAARARSIFSRRGRALASTLAGDGGKKHRPTASATRRGREREGEKCCLHCRPPSAPSMFATAMPEDTRMSRLLAIIELAWERRELRRRDYKDLGGIEVYIWQVKSLSGSVNGRDARKWKHCCGIMQESWRKLTLIALFVHLVVTGDKIGMCLQGEINVENVGFSVKD